MALTQENRITSVEKDIQSVAKKVERLERIDWKIDTLLVRTAPKLQQPQIYKLNLRQCWKMISSERTLFTSRAVQSMKYGLLFIVTE